MASELTADPFEDLSASPPPLPDHKKKNWHELRQAVRKTRRLAASLINRIPHSFVFRHIETDCGQVTRLYFLGVPSGSRENTLLYVDLPQDCAPEEQLEWRHLLDSFHATPLHGQFSKEEQLLRERKRLGSFGITSYDYNEETGRFVFPACNSLFYCNDLLSDGVLETRPTVPLEAKSSCLGSRLDPKMCPTNPDLLAYIHSNDVWVTNLMSGHEHRLTFAHKGLKHLADDPCSAGVPSFVVQEEFDRYTGYWWQPTTTQSSSNGVYNILYEEVDESSVEILTIQSSCGEVDGGVDEYRYPRAGTPNAKCNLKLLQFELAPNGDIINITDKQLVEPLSTLFPWMEYIPRAGWTSDGKNVYVELLDRVQQKLQLVLIPVECFCINSSSSQDVVMYDDLLSLPPIQVIYEDTSTIWVNVHDSLHFFPQEDDSDISFIWASEKTGYRHLYYVTSKLTVTPKSSNGSAEPMQTADIADPMRPNVFQEVQLTSGAWETIGKKIWVDETKGLVYFMGLKDTPLETHLYVVSYRSPSTVFRLTEANYSHTVSLDKDCSMFMSVFSSISQAPSSQLYSITDTDDGKIQAYHVYSLLNSTALSEEYHPPELFNFSSSAGATMYGMFYRPHDLEVGRKYPTVVFVYGGPQVQLVTNAFKGIRFLRLHTLASLGYAVVVIDTRGSCHRGLHFECHIKHRLGTVEIEDQVEGLHYLASQVDFIDLNRVAIHGWSYGGYLSLMGLCQRPDIFRVAVAGAPVTSWLLYDTGYTERYMASPEANPQGYKDSSVLEHTHNFPSDGNRLLIVHGLIDENVHFSHTSQLVNALVKACKPYQLQVYPNERHGIRNPEASEHYETMVLNFLQENL